MGNSDLTYSEIIYLFAEQFVKKADIFDCNEFISDIRVEQKQLAEMLCLGSLLYLMDKNIINLEIIEIENKILFLVHSKKSIIISKKKSCHRGLYGIEIKIFEAIAYRETVSDIIKNLIPDGCDNDPWDEVISIVREDLILRGYLSIEEQRSLSSFLFGDHYIVNQEKTSGLEKMLSQTKYSLSTFKSYKYRDLCKKTSDEIRDAIKSKLIVYGC